MARSTELSVVAGADPLPVLGAVACERSDAARNRRKILAAAERLFERHGTENVSMDAIAEAAGVGKGTLYRRFGDRRGLAYAILDEREREFQEQLIRGESPLGPGAPARERLLAFGEAIAGRLAKFGDLLLAAETGAPMARFRASVYGTHRAHVRTLLREINPQLDDAYFADVLLAALSAELVNFWRGQSDWSEDRVVAGFRVLVDRLV